MANMTKEKMMAEAAKLFGGSEERDPLSMAAPRHVNEPQADEDIDPDTEEIELIGEGGDDADKVGTDVPADEDDSAQDTVDEPATDAANPWDDYEDIEYEDADSGEKYTVRAPKSQAQKVRDGYLRRSVMDRNARYLSKYRAVLEPLITSGQFESIAPLLERGLTDSEFAEFLGEAYTRRVSGQPLKTELKDAQRAVDAALAAPTEPSSEPNAFADDPLLGEFMREIDKRLESRIAPINESLKTQAIEAQRRAAFEAQQRQFAAEAQRVYGQISNDLRTLYPEHFDGNPQNEAPKLKQIYDYAVSAQYIRQNSTPQESYLGLRLAHNEIYGRGQAVSSPAAEALKSQQTARNAAATAARAVATSISGGRNVATPTVLSIEEKLRRVATKKDDKPRKASDVVKDAMRVIENNA